MADKYKIRHRSSKVEREVTSREWDAIQKNSLVASKYIVVSAPTPKVVKPSEKESSDKQK